MRKALVIAATLAGLGVSFLTPAIGKPSKCDLAWASCNRNTLKCQDQGRCMIRCDQKYALCKP